MPYGGFSRLYAVGKIYVLTQDWYKNAVAWAASQGITGGTSENTFSPDENVTIELTITQLKQYETTRANYVRNSGQSSTTCTEVKGILLSDLLTHYVPYGDSALYVVTFDSSTDEFYVNGNEPGGDTLY